MQGRRRSRRIHKLLMERERKKSPETFVDRISPLPDDVILHILSFLRTKHSVATSALSKRWRFLWAHVPSLDFTRYRPNGDKTPLPGIIDRFMAQHKAEIINTLKLHVEHCTANQLETWIASAVHRSVRNLILEYCSDLKDLLTVPRCLLAFKTLVDLKLQRCRGIPSSGEVFLPSLEKLCLMYVEYEDDESLPHLLSGCPVLEELIIKYAFRDDQQNLGCLDVSSPTIKKLDVEFSYSNELYDHTLIINAPALEKLSVVTCSLEYITIGSGRIMTSLIEADFYFDYRFDAKYEYTDPSFTSTIELFRCLCNLKCLTIDLENIDEEIVDILVSHIKLDSLTKLELLLKNSWDTRILFLEVADNLEELILHLDTMYPYWDPIRVPACISSHLRTVRINNFITICDMVIVGYILWNAKVLERMEIYPPFNWDEVNPEAQEEILLFERGSKSCQVEFYRSS